MPAWPAMAGLATLGLIAVLVLPAVGGSLPWETDPEPNASQVALTALGVVLLTGAYVWAVAREGGLGGATPALLTFGYLAGIAVVKFVLSPASFHNTEDASLTRYLWLGLGVMVLYLAGLAGVYWLARRYEDEWRLPSKVATVAGVLVFAVFGSQVGGELWGRDIGNYVADVLWGAGLWLLALLGASAAAAVDAFDRPERDVSFRAGLGVIVVYHGLWVAYMLRLFD